MHRIPRIPRVFQVQRIPRVFHVSRFVVTLFVIHCPYFLELKQVTGQVTQNEPSRITGPGIYRRINSVKALNRTQSTDDQPGKFTHCNPSSLDLKAFYVIFIQSWLHVTTIYFNIRTAIFCQNFYSLRVLFAYL